MKTNNSEEIKIKLDKLICKVEFFKYQNGRLGFKLVSLKNNSSIAVCTVNIDNLTVYENEVIIKDYNENHGMYKLLLNSKFINGYIRTIKIGNNNAYLCKLNNDYVYEDIIKPHKENLLTN